MIAPKMTVIAALFAAIACQKPSTQREEPQQVEEPEMRETEEDEQPEGAPSREETLRHAMVQEQIVGRGITNERVIAAMSKIPRHEFVPDAWRYRAYMDGPSPIGHDQTISQPYIVAIMTELLEPEPGEKILEIGTGSGYQAAVLAEMGVKLYSIEIVCELAEEADEVLERLNYDDVQVRCGDGYKGWPTKAPFDGIIVTAAPPEIPQALVDQLAPGGRMVVPVGQNYQTLQVITKNSDGTTNIRRVFDVRFVPMVHGPDAGLPGVPDDLDSE